ncbi:hypothetical protein PRIPAC_77476 [Pristionchus pacificus]|uniref:Uncharacterized protein n=1 Tax=Pristionchus pacificus TaxID=54126 RepID=A0A2A6C3R5_PRIPA|nr:hypothetical protein PRIPAC_77476 [Pristionchus pacificus]|eukprot:PDM72766.1 hypothetical protein PRIPAC_39200 [Pristionchus pacificus]
MEQDKITPEQIEAEVEKAVAFYKESVVLSSKFYEQQIDRVIEFHKTQCDRYFENNIPMLTNQVDAMERAFSGEFSAWNDTVFRLGSTLCASLANLASNCTEPLTEEKHPSAQFVIKTTGEYEEKLNKFQEEMLEKREEASQYRGKEREEIQTRFRQLTQKREAIEMAIQQ